MTHLLALLKFKKYGIRVGVMLSCEEDDWVGEVATFDFGKFDLIIKNNCTGKIKEPRTGSELQDSEI